MPAGTCFVNSDVGAGNPEAASHRAVQTSLTGLETYAATAWARITMTDRRTGCSGALGGIRTHDLSLRRAALYPAELQARDVSSLSGNTPVDGAEGEIRTRTSLRTLRPERSASTVSPPRRSPASHSFLDRAGGGRWGTRTSDLLRVKQAL